MRIDESSGDLTLAARFSELNSHLGTIYLANSPKRMKINSIIFHNKFDTFVLQLKTWTMVTVIFDIRSTEARKMLEFL